MKKWRILYWCGLYRTVHFIKADSMEEARCKFVNLYGIRFDDIIEISEASLLDHN